MADFLLGAAVWCSRSLALGLARILHGPSQVDRIMAAQLLGTGGTAGLLLLGQGIGLPSAVDVALILALLAAFVSVAFFTNSGSDANRG